MGRLEVSGIGKTSGGKYDTVHIEGVGKVQGNLECNLYEVEGVSEVTGDIRATRILLTGTAKVQGDLESESFDIEGVAKVKGNCHVKERLKVRGSLKVNSSVKAGMVESDGVLDIGGELSANTVSIELQNRDSRVESIMAQNIDVKQGRWFRKRRLVTRIIEGDTVVLEDTTADIVRGNTVILHEGCKVKTVEYRLSCNVDKKASVREKKRI